MKPNVEDAKREWEYIYNVTGIANIYSEDDIVDYFRYLKAEGVDWDAGCTRLVCWRKDGDYVFKIDMENESAYSGNYRVNCSSTPEKNTADESFTEHELSIYQDACAEGLGDLFAWEEYLGVYPIEDGYIHIYTMERVEIDYDKNMADSRESFESTHSVEECAEVPEYYFSDEDYMLKLAQAEWNDDALFEDFSRFIESVDLNDLHAGNWGRKNGRLVVTDYAGF